MDSALAPIAPWRLKDLESDQVGKEELLGLVDTAYAGWVRLAEDELAAFHDFNRDDHPKYFGRDLPTRIVWDNAHLKYMGGIKARGHALLWRTLAARVQALRAAALSKNWPLVHQIGIRLAKFTCPFKEKPADWKWWRSCARKIRWGYWHGHADWVDEIYVRLTSLHTSVEQLAAKTRAKAWREWATVDAMANGARRAHRWVKGQPPPRGAVL